MEFRRVLFRSWAAANAAAPPAAVASKFLRVIGYRSPVSRPVRHTPALPTLTVALRQYRAFESGSSYTSRPFAIHLDTERSKRPENKPGITNRGRTERFQ